MVFIGLVVTFAGFLICVAGLGISDSASMRLIFALAGIAVSLFGIIGLINKAYLSKALWRKGE